MVAADSGLVRFAESPVLGVAVCLGADDCVPCAGVGVGVGVGLADASGPSSSCLTVARICSTSDTSVP
jgi:hypothetical protein